MSQSKIYIRVNNVLLPKHIHRRSRENGSVEKCLHLAGDEFNYSYWCTPHIQTHFYNWNKVAFKLITDLIKDLIYSLHWAQNPSFFILNFLPSDPPTCDRHQRLQAQSLLFKILLFASGPSMYVQPL